MDQDNEKAPQKGKGRGKGKPAKPALAVVADNVVPMAKGQGKGAFGLTAKQNTFADKVAEGSTLAEAYRHAYSAENMAQTSIHSEACRLMANPLIAARVNRLIEQKKAKTSHDATRIRISVIERLQIEAHDMSNPATVRVRALELLGKMSDVSLFVDKVETMSVDARSPDEISKELKERLAKLAG